MLEQLQASAPLYQSDVVYEIAQKFGEEHVYENAAGNSAISKAVLAAFNDLTGDAVVWSRGERHWRPRESWDEAGRMQP